MRLLLDENLSQRLVPLPQDKYPGSSQAAVVDLERADDRMIWEYAKENGFIIVARDADFQELSTVFVSHPRSSAFACQTNRGRLC